MVSARFLVGLGGQRPPRVCAVLCVVCVPAEVYVEPLCVIVCSSGI